RNGPGTPSPSSSIVHLWVPATTCRQHTAAARRSRAPNPGSADEPLADLPYEVDDPVDVPAHLARRVRDQPGHAGAGERGHRLLVDRQPLSRGHGDLQRPELGRPLVRT